MDNKQSSVEWLYCELTIIERHYDKGVYTENEFLRLWNEARRKALIKHQEEISEAFDENKENDKGFFSGKHYYDKTYGKDNG